MKTLAFGLAVLLATPAAADDDAAALSRAFVQAWDANDAKALAGLFAPGADIVTPDGTVVSGATKIEAFYASVFAHGLKGVPATTRIERERDLAPGLAIVDARFAIGDKESGIMAAVLQKGDAGWRILALRENRGANAFSDFAP